MARLVSYFICSLLLTAPALAVSPEKVAQTAPAQRLFNRVNEVIAQNYGGLSTVDRQKLRAEFQSKLDAACEPQPQTCQVEAAYPIIDEELGALGDQHSYFQTPNDFKDFVLSITGGDRQQFGVKLAQLDGENRMILEVLPESAAEKAGLQRGDVLKSINGEPYLYARFQKARQAGETIRLGVERRGQQLDVLISPLESSTRDLPRLSFTGPKHDIAVLRIPTFLSSGGVAQKVHDFVGVAQSVGATGMVVDLRGNTGGSLIECDNAVSAFLPKFERLSRSTQGEQKTTVTEGARYEGLAVRGRVEQPRLWSGPVVVLVDQQSASCSEFFAYEIQHAKRGLIVGEQTAGVGNTATRIFPVGINTALQLTVTHYAKPDGELYPTSVLPDLPYTQGEAELRLLATGEDALLNAGISALYGVGTQPLTGNGKH